MSFVFSRSSSVSRFLYTSSCLLLYYSPCQLWNLLWTGLVLSGIVSSHPFPALPRIRYLQPQHLDFLALLFAVVNKQLNCTCKWISSYCPWHNDPTKMDSVSAYELREFLSNNNAHKYRQVEQMMATGRAVQTLVAQVSKVTAQLQQLKTEAVRSPTVPHPPPVPFSSKRADLCIEPRLPLPASFSGEPQLCQAFVTKCSLFFSLQSASFPTWAF